MATPQVAGTFAAIRSACPNATVDQILAARALQWKFGYPGVCFFLRLRTTNRRAKQLDQQ
jgi:hypothetical protein